MDNVATVVHLLSTDLARGAQRYARQLCDALEGPEVRHEMWTLFDAPDVTGPDRCLDGRSGRLRRLGLDPRVASRLGRALRAERPLVLVVHGSEPLKYAAVTVRGDLPVVYYKIGVATDDVHRPPRRGLHRWLVRRPDAIACVSEEARDEMIGLLRADPARVSVIPNGRDPAVFRPADPDPARVPRAVFVGHLTPSKRPELFVQVVSELRDRRRELDAIVVGDGPLAGTIERLASEIGFQFLGRRDDVPGILRDCDVFVFTSVPAGEGMPGVLIEASLSGLPVVTTDVPGASTVVEDGVTGYVVEVDDRRALTDAVGRLVDDADLRARMGAAARDRSARRFAFEVTAQQWTSLLDEVVAGAAARPA